MKALLSQIAASLFSMCLLASACHAADLGTTLESKDVSYSATITLQNAGHDSDGKRIVSYRINLASTKCKSVIAGNAKFYSKTDNLQDDSAYLRNGEVVKTNIFKDNGKNGEVVITMDVESKKPRYAGVLINKAVAVSGSCFKTNEVSYDFFN
jgi:hypothetical protein